MSQPGESGDRDLRDRLRELRVDPPDEGFQASLHRRLVEAGPPDVPGVWRRLWLRMRHSRLFWPAFGVAAGLAAILVLGVLREAPSPSMPLVPTTKVALVRVNLSAEVAVESAQIKVTLPEGLVFWADGQEIPGRAFEWTQALRAGDNDIPIAVRGLRPGRYRITLSARIAREWIEDHVLIEVTPG